MQWPLLQVQLHCIDKIMCLQQVMGPGSPSSERLGSVDVYNGEGDKTLMEDDGYVHMTLGTWHGISLM